MKTLSILMFFQDLFPFWHFCRDLSTALNPAHQLLGNRRSSIIPGEDLVSKTQKDKCLNIRKSFNPYKINYNLSISLNLTKGYIKAKCRKAQEINSRHAKEVHLLALTVIVPCFTSLDWFAWLSRIFFITVGDQSCKIDQPNKRDWNSVKKNNKVMNYLIKKRQN